VNTTAFELAQAERTNERRVEAESSVPEYARPVVLSAFECEAMDETLLEAA
jgi:hypothetical protein